MTKSNPASTAPAFYTTADVCRLLNIGITKFKELRSSGGFGVRPLRLGKKILYPAAELQSWIDASTEAGRFITFDQWQKVRAAR